MGLAILVFVPDCAGRFTKTSLPVQNLLAFETRWGQPLFPRSCVFLDNHFYLCEMLILGTQVIFENSAAIICHAREMFLDC